MKVVSINPGFKFNTQQILDAVERGLDRAAEEVQRDFGFTTETWEEHHPVFEIISVPSKRTIQTNDDIYRFLNDGTAIRYATMTNPFAPKTEPGVIGSQAGVGRLNYISRARPRPGIIAREFDKAIAERFQQGRLAEILQEEISKTP